MIVSESHWTGHGVTKIGFYTIVLSGTASTCAMKPLWSTLYMAAASWEIAHVCRLGRFEVFKQTPPPPFTKKGPLLVKKVRFSGLQCI